MPSLTTSISTLSALQAELPANTTYIQVGKYTSVQYISPNLFFDEGLGINMQIGCKATSIDPSDAAQNILSNLINEGYDPNTKIPI